jgi:predicted AAA+ superfamily ATPase
MYINHTAIGEIVENMIGGNIVDKFKALGYDVISHSRNKVFGEGTTDSGEIDMLLEDGEVAILIEVKTTLKVPDVREHITRLKKHRRCIDAKGSDKRRFVGAVAGAVVREDAAKFAQKNGLFVIVQSGDAVEIVTPPKGFKAKEW